MRQRKVNGSGRPWLAMIHLPHGPSPLSERIPLGACWACFTCTAGDWIESDRIGSCQVGSYQTPETEARTPRLPRGSDAHPASALALNFPLAPHAPHA